jgi:hypothetical protein
MPKFLFFNPNKYTSDTSFLRLRAKMNIINDNNIISCVKNFGIILQFIYILNNFTPETNAIIFFALERELTFITDSELLSSLVFFLTFF